MTNVILFVFLSDSLDRNVSSFFTSFWSNHRSLWGIKSRDVLNGSIQVIIIGSDLVHIGVNLSDLVLLQFS